MILRTKCCRKIAWRCASNFPSAYDAANWTPIINCLVDLIRAVKIKFCCQDKKEWEKTMKYIGTTGTVKIRNVSYVCIYEGKGRKIQNMYGYKCSGSYLLLFSNFAKHFTFTTHVCQKANTSCDAAEMVSDVTYVSSCGKRPYKRFDCFCKTWKPHKTRNIYEL